MRSFRGACVVHLTGGRYPMASDDLKAKFPNLIPGKKPPALSRVNGCGVAMYGRRDFDADTRTYISTWCLSLVFMPVMCLRAFRVADAPGGGWYFIGREPLSGIAKSWNTVLIAAILAIVGAVQYESYTS